MSKETDSVSLWIFKNFKETIDVIPKKYRGRAWEILINYAFGEVEDLEKENNYIQIAVKSLIPLIKLRGKGGSKKGISNNPSGTKKPNVGANVGATIKPNVGATPLITETETITEKETETITINNNNKPDKKDIETYCNLLGKKIDLETFYAYYDASEWKDKDGNPLNWKQKVIQWAKREPIKPKEEKFDYANTPYNAFA